MERIRAQLAPVFPAVVIAVVMARRSRQTLAATIAKAAQRVLPTARRVLFVHSQWLLTMGLKEGPTRTMATLLHLKVRMAVAT